MSTESLPKRPYIGGQAVLEGVMMRAPSSFAIVVRRKDGSLHVRERSMTDGRTGISKWPFFRGVASLVESLRLGSEALKFSAEQYEKDHVEPQPSAKGLSVLSAFGLALFSLVTRADGESAPKQEGRGGMGIMLLAMVAIMILLPQAAATGVNNALHWGLQIQSPKFQLLTGAFKLTIVIGYLLVIRRVPDIRRVFQYHGAEHKTISTYEAEEELTVENARKKTTLHPRCGTTFLVMIALVSVALFTILGAVLPRIQTGTALLDNLLFFLVKVPFIPVIAAITFELQRVFARFFTKGPLRVVLLPGFAVQKITTIEPDDAQLEVALASLRVTLFREQGQAAKEGGESVFGDYASILHADGLWENAGA